MRIVLFDSILESHVVRSLERSLIDRGHTVKSTGRLGSGFTMETDRHRLAAIGEQVDRTVDFAPDLVVVFRPASLAPHLLRRLRQTRAHLAAWLSDDPVLWNLSYRHVIDLYDTVLHCGAERVLRFYDEQLRRPVGVNFPFWTDNVEFPLVYGTRPVETPAMLLGNTHGAIRRRRYYMLAGLTAPVRIHGRTGIDFAQLGAGQLDSSAEVADAAARSRVALSFPQHFTDHRGQPTWFDELAVLGTFQYPSRIIQYAAMGLPILSVTPTPEDYREFPEIVTAEPDRLDATLRELLTAADLSDLSQRTHTRFLRHFSASSRAEALESLVSQGDWRDLSVEERASWFSRFDGTRAPMPVDHVRVQSRISLRRRWVSPRSIVLLGDCTDDVTSPASVAKRALQRLGHNVGLPVRGHEPTPGILDAAHLTPLLNRAERVEAVMIVGDHVQLSDDASQLLRDRGVALLHHAVTGAVEAETRMRIARAADAATFTDEKVVNMLRAQGFHRVSMVPPLVDGDFLDIAEGNDQQRAEIQVIAPSGLSLEQPPGLWEDLRHVGGVLVERETVLRSDLPGLLDRFSSAVTVMIPDRPGEVPPELPFVMAAGGLAVLPRSTHTTSPGTPGTSHLLAHEPRELTSKLLRLRRSPERFEQILRAARAVVQEEMNAERRIDNLLSNAIAHRDERQQHPRDLTCTEPDPQPGIVSEFTAPLAPRGYSDSLVTITVRGDQRTPGTDVSAFELSILLDDHRLATARMDLLPPETVICLHLPATQPRETLCLQLTAKRAPGRRNWADVLGLSIGLSERRVRSRSPELRITSTHPCFVSR